MKCRKQTGTNNLQHALAKNGRHMVKGQCQTCGANKSRFVSEKDLKEGGFLGFLGKLFGMGLKKT